LRTLLAGRAALYAAAGLAIAGLGILGSSLAAHGAVGSASDTCASVPAGEGVAAAFVTISPAPSVSPSALPTVFASPSPDPSASPSPTSPVPARSAAQLCVLSQAVSASQVTAGSLASFQVWVWSVQAASTDVSVSAQVTSGSNVGTPAFTSCPAASGTACSLGKLRVGHVDELEATLPVQAGAPAGELVELTVQATAANAVGYSSTATDVVTTDPQAESTSPALQVPGALPTVPVQAGSASAADPASSLFPTVQPSAVTPSLPLDQATSLADTTSERPTLNAALEAQLAGAAVLGLGIIGLVMLRLRTARPAAARPGRQPQRPDSKPQP
jgi:hypothetical protein